MLYKRYYDRTHRLAVLLGYLYRFRVLIIATLSAIALTTGTLAATKGLIVSESECPTELVYGDTLIYTAEAFLGDVHYEYSPADEAAWTTVPPVTVGRYRVRAVSTSSFDNSRYGKEHIYTITPLPVTVSVAEDTVPYGDTPALSADLLFDHTVTGGVIYQDLADTSTPTVMADRASVRMLAPDGTDMTENYTVNATPTSTVTIVPRDIQVTVEDRDQIFNDLALTFDGYELTGGSLVEGDQMVAVVNDAITDVGTLSNTPEMQVFNPSGVNVSRHYAIELIEGTLTVNTRPLYITTADQTTVYDGTDHTCHEFTVGDEMPLVEGHTIRVVADTTVCQAGTRENYLDLRVLDGNGVEETDNYSRILTLGALTVTPRPVTVVTPSESFEYDGTAHQSTTLPEGYAAAGDTLVIDPASVTSVRDVAEGSVPNTLTVTFRRDGVDVSASYTVDYAPGALTVTPRPVAVMTPDLSVVYDAAEHTATDFVLTYAGNATAEGKLPAALASADMAVVRPETLTTVRDVVEAQSNEYALTFTRSADGEPEDISDNYDVTYTYGTLTVTPRPILVKVKELSKLYDATPLSGSEAEALEELAAGQYPLANGHTVHLSTEGAQLDAGTSENRYVAGTLRILEGEADVTANYTVLDVQNGVLTVEPRPITVTAGSGTWLYDGAEHRSTDYRVDCTVDPTAPALVSDHAITVSVEGSCRYVLRDPTVEGSYRSTANTVNAAETHIMSGERDVSANYAITYAEGALTVLPRPVTVTADSGVWLYDGTPKSMPSCVYAWAEKPVGDLWDAIELPSALSPLLDTDRPTVTYDGTYTSAGPYTPEAGATPYENRITAIRITTEEGVDVTDNYLLTPVAGELTILPRPITVTAGSGTWLYDGTTHSLGDYTVTWSEKPLGEEWADIDLGDEPILPGQYLIASLVGSYTDVERRSDNTYAARPNEVGEVALMVAETTEEVTGSYLITRVSGSITLLPRPVTVTSPTASWIYDGYEKQSTQPLLAWTDMDWTTGQWAEVTPPSADEPCLAAGEWADIAITGRATHVRRGPDREVYTYPNTIVPADSTVRAANGRDVGDNYDLVFMEGTLTIEPRPIKVITDSGAWIYDDTPTSLPGFGILLDHPWMGLPDQHGVEAVDVPAFVDAGDYRNELAVRVLSYMNGWPEEDVTDDFAITYDYGTVRIHRRPITVYPSSAAKIYDDTPLTSEAYTIGGDYGLVIGHTDALRIEGTLTDAGISENRYVPDSAVIRRPDGTDVTANYAIDTVPGVLEVKARPITVTTESHIWLYDGAEHMWERADTAMTPILWEAPEWSYVTRPAEYGPPILDGQRLSLVYTGACTDVVGGDLLKGYASCPNTVDPAGTVILASDGRDVTRNYAITYVYGGLTILPRPVAVTSEDHTWIYDAEPHTWDGFVVAWGVKPMGEQWADIRLPTAESALVDGEVAQVSVVGSITDVVGGSMSRGYDSWPNSIDTSATRFTADGRDVTGNYVVVTYIEGDLTVLPRPITVTSSSMTWIYDGTTHRHHETEPDRWSALPSGAQWTGMTLPAGEPLVAGHQKHVAFTGECTYVLWQNGRVSSVENTFDRFLAGYGSRILDANGRDVTHNYHVTSVCGALTVEPRPITVQCGGGETVYNGQLQYLANGCDLSASSPYPLPDIPSHVMYPEQVPGFMDAGVYENRHAVRIYAQTATGSEREVTDCFEIRYLSGTVTIHRRPVALQILDNEKIYNGKPLRSDKATFDPSYPGAWAPIDGHYVTVDTTGELTEPGTVVSEYVDGSAVIRDRNDRDVTANYEILHVAPGTLTVLPRPITIQTASAEKIYDGTPLTAPTAAVVPIGMVLVEGHRFELSVTGSLTDVGTAPNTCDPATLRIYDAAGREVTHCYAVTFKEGKLVVRQRPITIETASADKIYDGTPLTAPTASVSADGMTLVAGHRFDLSVTGSRTDAGSSPNTCDRTSLRIYDANGRDVTFCYAVTLREGRLVVYPRPIRVESASAQKPYDGTPLTAPYVTFLDSGMTLVSGQILELTVTGSQTEIGISPNTYHRETLRVSDFNGRDVTFCYDITLTEGTLAVTKPGEGGGDSGGGPGEGPITNGMITGDISNDNYLPSLGEDVIALRLLADKALSVFLRQQSFGDYAHTGWKEAPAFDLSDAPIHPLYLSALALLKAGYAPEDISVNLILETGYLLPYYTVDGPDAQRTDSIFHLDERQYSLSVIPALDPDPDLLAALRVPEEYAVFEAEYRAFVHENYLSLPADTRAALEEILAATDLDADSETLIRDIQEYIRNKVPYQFDFAPYPDDVDRVIYFLTEAEGAVCRHYASAAVLVYRLFGIPARYTVGYAGQTTPGTWADVSVLNAHAWVELYIDGLGWVAIDVTGSFEGLGPDAGVDGGELPDEDEDEELPPDLDDGEFVPPDFTGESVLVGQVMAQHTGILYLRENSAGFYLGDARVWGLATSYDGLLPGGFNYNYLPSLTLGDRGVMQFRNMLLSMLPYYLAMGENATVKPGSDVANLFDDTTYMVDYAFSPKEITWINRYRSMSEDDLRVLLGEFYELELAYRQSVYAQYLQIDRETLAYMQSVIEAQGFDVTDPGVVAKVAYFIQNAATYNLMYDPALDAGGDVAVTFLRDFKEGICVHYATSATMLFRALGIPARYTVGYMVPVEAGVWTEIWAGGMLNQGHAWVEVYINGLGWVQVEVTGSAEGGNGGMGDGPVPSEKPVLSLKPAYNNKLYDSLPLTHDRTLLGNEVFDALMAQGFYYDVQVSGSQTEVGRSPSRIESFVLYDPAGHDVTDQYSLQFEEGVLEVSLLQIDVFVYQNRKEYDGTPLVYGTHDYYVFSIPDGMELKMELNISLLDVQKLTLDELNINRSQYMTYTVLQNGVDVTADVTLRFVNIFGVYEPDEVVAEITPRLLELTANSKSAVYTEGAILQDAGWSVSKNPVLPGHRIDEASVTVLGTCTEPNQIGVNVINESSIFIYDRDGNDVTRNYAIVCIRGELQFVTDD